MLNERKIYDGTNEPLPEAHRVHGSEEAGEIMIGADLVPCAVVRIDGKR